MPDFSGFFPHNQFWRWQTHLSFSLHCCVYHPTSQWIHPIVRTALRVSAVRVWEFFPIISFEDDRRICHFPLYHPTTSQWIFLFYFPTVLPYVFTLEISPIISFEDDRCICHFLADSEEPGTLSAFRAHCVRMFREFFPIISLEDDRRICHLRRYCIIPFH